MKSGAKLGAEASSPTGPMQVYHHIEIRPQVTVRTGYNMPKICQCQWGCQTPHLVLRAWVGSKPLVSMLQLHTLRTLIPETPYHQSSNLKPETLDPKAYRPCSRQPESLFLHAKPLVPKPSTLNIIGPGPYKAHVEALA